MPTSPSFFQEIFGTSGFYFYLCAMKHLLTVILLLLSLSCCTTEADRNRMRAGLDSLNQRNRTDQPFTVQEVEHYVRFFDDHGTDDDRLLAHYLLGRAYYEHGDAPMALQCYLDAIDCADTTIQDFDYAQLSRVYGQMAEVFYYQGLYRQHLQYGQMSVRYAWKGKDTLLALMNYEQESFAYNKLGMQDSAIFIVENVAAKYEQYGYPSDAAIALGTIIRTLTAMGEYQKAKQYMDIYESKSGLFDAQGNIAKGREIYYRVKGLYYFHTNKLDSAEYYFRKELHNGKDFNNQNAAALGLSEIYRKQLRNDSSTKYATYAYAMNDSVYAHNTIQTVERMQAMYDYTRHQEIARRETEKATQANRQLLFSLIALLATSLVSSWLYIGRKQIIENLHSTSSELTSVREELTELQQNSSSNQQSILEKEKRIKQLERKLGKYGKLVYFGTAKAENDLQLSPCFQKMKEMACKGQVFHEEDWSIVNQLIQEYFPGFMDFLTSSLKNGSIEYQVCLLLRLHFKAGEIAGVLSVTPPYISKICTTVLASIFEKRGSSKELAKELDKIN